MAMSEQLHHSRIPHRHRLVRPGVAHLGGESLVLLPVLLRYGRRTRSSRPIFCRRQPEPSEPCDLPCSRYANQATYRPVGGRAFTLAKRRHTSPRHIDSPATTRGASVDPFVFVGVRVSHFSMCSLPLGISDVLPRWIDSLSPSGVSGCHSTRTFWGTCWTTGMSIHSLPLRIGIPSPSCGCVGLCMSRSFHHWILRSRDRQVPCTLTRRQCMPT